MQLKVYENHLFTAEFRPASGISGKPPSQRTGEYHVVIQQFATDNGNHYQPRCLMVKLPWLLIVGPHVLPKGRLTMFFCFPGNLSPSKIDRQIPRWMDGWIDR